MRIYEERKIWRIGVSLVCCFFGESKFGLWIFFVSFFKARSIFGAVNDLFWFLFLASFLLLTRGVEFRFFLATDLHVY